MTAFTIAGANLRRFLRERSNVFFVFILPIAIVLLVGAQFGGDSAPELGVYVDEPVSSFNATVLEELGEVRRFDDPDVMVKTVERGGLSAGVLLLEGDVGDDPGSVRFVAGPDGLGANLRAVVDRAIALASVEAAAEQFVIDRGVAPEVAAGVAEAVSAQVAPIEVTTLTTGSSLFPADVGTFDIGASGQVVLFMFLTGLTGSAALIQTRQLGVSRRMLSTPTSIGSIIVGEALGRFVVVLLQGLYIVVVSAVAFGVDWGDPIGATALIVVFAAVGAGAAMLAGSVFRNDQQAAGIGVVAGLTLAALGGSMLPLELFSGVMRTVARFTPHGWANEGFSELVIHNGTIGDILGVLGVLALMAVGLVAVAGWRLWRVITR